MNQKHHVFIVDMNIAMTLQNQMNLIEKQMIEHIV